MEPQNDKNSKPVWWWQPMQMFLRMSGWIAFPLIMSLFLGKWLDEKFNTAPWLLIVLSVFAFTVSMYGVIATAKKEFKKIEDENKKK
jgi:F0F1-type ATP synthase assembly protein I